jgi:hypothetical protein
VDNALAPVAAADVLEKGTRLKVIAGKPVFENGKSVFVPVFEDDVKLGGSY